jgi:hypothetical protein
MPLLFTRVYLCVGYGYNIFPCTLHYYTEGNTVEICNVKKTTNVMLLHTGVRGSYPFFLVWFN